MVVTIIVVGGGPGCGVGGPGGGFGGPGGGFSGSRSSGKPLLLLRLKKPPPGPQKPVPGPPGPPRNSLLGEGAQLLRGSEYPRNV